MNLNFKTLRYLNEPMRIMGLTVDDFAIGVISMLLLLGSEHKLFGIIFALSLVSALKVLKKGARPSFVLVLMYWYLPGFVTKVMGKSLPESAHKVLLG
jgi:type IV conjugative transfer system protein TraL